MKTMRLSAVFVLLLVFFANPLSAKINKTWELATEDSVTSLVCYANHVFAGQSDGSVVALAVDTGKVLWKSKVDGKGPVLLSVKAGALYVIREATVTTLDPMTAKVVARKPLPFFIDDTTLLGRAPVADRLILQRQGQTHILDPRNGKALFSADHPIFFGPPGQSLYSRKWRDSFDELQGIGYLVDQRAVVAVNLKTGAVVWKAESPSELFGAPVHFKRLVIAAGPEILLAVHEKDGKRAWVDDRFEEAKAVSPYLFFVTPKERERFYLHVEGGLLAHHFDSARRNFHYLAPDPMQILFSAGPDAFLLYVYREEASGQTRSMLFRLSNKTAQLYGHDDVAGKATGLYLQTGRRIYPELTPGVLFELGRKECSLLDRMHLSDHPIVFMDNIGHAGVIALSEKKLIGISLK